MVNRQRALARLISNEGGNIANLRLMKLAFLLSQTAEALPKSSLYDFVPYHFGPYSFTLTYELRSMERDGWTQLTKDGVQILREAEVEFKSCDYDLLQQVDSISRRFRNVSTPNLVSKVYREYPWYTALAKDQKLRAAVIPTATPRVFTVGYEGMTLDGFLDLLLRSGIKRVIDVRSNPIARRFGFHKSTMERHCGDVGITYLHVPELGIPSERRSGLSDSKSYDRLFKYYDSKILATKPDALMSVASVISAEPSALMCMEADAAFCHRSRLAAAITTTTKLPIKELRAP